MDRWGVFVIWRREYPGRKIPVQLMGVKDERTEADARGEASEYLAYAPRPLGNLEYGYTEINPRVRAFVRAMRRRPDADGRNTLATFSEDEHEQLDLYSDALGLEE